MTTKPKAGYVQTTSEFTVYYNDNITCVNKCLVQTTSEFTVYYNNCLCTVFHKWYKLHQNLQYITTSIEIKCTNYIRIYSILQQNRMLPLPFCV